LVLPEVEVLVPVVVWALVAVPVPVLVSGVAVLVVP
jgi:hypothetical protein